jgi:hypothetical protein
MFICGIKTTVYEQLNHIVLESIIRLTELSPILYNLYQNLEQNMFQYVKVNLIKIVDRH